MFKDNKYKKWYYDIINKAISYNRVKSDLIYYEKHHIIPKSIGGDNRKHNLVLLNPREHFICHRLLCKMVINITHKQKMNASLAYFTNNSKRRLPSRYIDIARKYNGINKKGQIPWNKGIPHTEETKIKISVKNSRSTLTEEGRKKKSEFTKNNNPMNNKEYAEKARMNHSKDYIVIDPQGTEYKIKNLAQFCRDYNLSNSNLCSVSKGKLEHYKGWKCIKLN